MKKKDNLTTIHQDFLRNNGVSVRDFPVAIRKKVIIYQQMKSRYDKLTFPSKTGLENKLNELDKEIYRDMVEELEEELGYDFLDVDPSEHKKLLHSTFKSLEKVFPTLKKIVSSDHQVMSFFNDDNNRGLRVSQEIEESTCKTSSVINLEEFMKEESRLKEVLIKVAVDFENKTVEAQAASLSNQNWSKYGEVVALQNMEAIQLTNQLTHVLKNWLNDLISDGIVFPDLIDQKEKGSGQFKDTYIEDESLLDELWKINRKRDVPRSFLKQIGIKTPLKGWSVKIGSYTLIRSSWYSYKFNLKKEEKNIDK